MEAEMRELMIHIQEILQFLLTVSDKMYNSIVKIKTKNIVGTGFLMKIEKNNVKKFLFTCSIL